MALGAAIGSIAAPIAGSLIGRFASGADRRRAESALDAAFAEIDKVGAPPDLSAEIIKEKFELVGLLTPELEQEIDVGISEVAEIKEDTSLRDAQTKALQSLQERGEAGFTAEEQADLAQLQTEVARQAEAKRQQILQNLAQRGQGSSGTALAAQLQAAQDGANLQSQRGLDIAAEGQRRALQSIAQTGQLGGQIRAQDFGVNEARARAADELQRFKVAQDIGRQQRNTGRLNDAQLRNLQAQQRVADLNVQQINAERERQSQAKRQFFLDQLNVAQVRAGNERGKAGFLSGKARDTQQLFSGLGRGAGQAFSAFGGGGAAPSTANQIDNVDFGSIDPNRTIG